MARRRRTYRTPARRTSRRPATRRRTTKTPHGTVVAVVAVLAVLTWIASHPALLGLGILITAAVVIGRGIQQVRNRTANRALQAARAQHIAGYLTMNPGEFERALAYLCERDGCTQVRVVGGAGDLGADVIATAPDGRRIVIQAKRYSPSNRVGSQAVQTVNGTYRDAHGGHLAAIVTTSDFTRPARDFAQQVGIRLYNQTNLAGWASGTGPAPWH